jgi:hypothetical protein
MSYSVQWHRLPVSGPQSSHVWVWHLSHQIHEAEAALPKGQWEEIDPTNLQTPFLALISQLADTWTVLERGTTLKTWARKEDVRYVRSYPIILAFQTAGERTLAPDPAPRIGELGLAIEGESLHLYTLETLGDAGSTLCQQLQAALNTPQPDAPDFSGLDAAWREAQDTARELARLYWEAHKASAQLTPKRSSAPPTPYVMGNTFPVVAALPVQAALAAYSNAQSGAEQWREDLQQFPTFTYIKGEGTTHVQVRPYDRSAILDESTLTALWHQVSQLSDLDGDVLLAMLAQVIATPPDEKGCHWIKGTQILDYRGIKPKTHTEKGGQKRRAGHRQEDLVDIARCIGHMSNTYITVRQWIGNDEINSGKKRKNARKRLFTQESRLVNITDTIYQYELQFVNGAANRPEREPVAIAWRYQLGSWIDPFLKGYDRQIAWLLQQVLSYDPYHETWEKRLARYFTFHMRITTMGGGISIVRQVGSLINELSLPVDYRNPEKTKKRFEKALKRLVDDGQIDEWNYMEDLSLLPPRKWLETWLTYELRVYTAPINIRLPEQERQLLEQPADQ